MNGPSMSLTRISRVSVISLVTTKPASPFHHDSPKSAFSSPSPLRKPKEKGLVKGPIG